MNLQEMTKDELVAYAAELQRALADSTKKQARLREAEEALRESEAKYRELVQNANSIILRWNRKGEVTFLNEFGQNFFGYSEEEIVGQHVVGTIVPETESGGRDLRPLMEQICANPRGFEHNVNENMLRDGSRVWIEWTNKAIFDERSQLVEIFSVGTDITERKRSEQALRDSEQRYRLLADNTLDVIWQTDLDLRFTYVNPAIFQVTGYTPDEWIGTRLTEHCDEENFMKMAQVASEEISKGADSSGPVFESVMLKKNKEPISVEIHGRVILGENGLPIALQGVTRDITDRKKAEDELRESERKYRDLFDGAPVGIFQSTIDGSLLSVNPKFAYMYWYASAEQAAREIDNAQGTYVEPERRKKLVDLALRTDGFVKAENQHRKKDGSMFWGQLYFRAVRDRDGEVKHLEGFVEDITDRKRAEEQIGKSLEEKEVLLREINHRVKNNLQVISSLLRLQSRQASDESGRHVLQETQNRLHTIALIHETLYQSKSLAHVDVERYIKHLVTDLIQLFGLKSSQIDMKIDIQGLGLGADKAGPLGLIANELVSNCLKYAFPAGRQGIIRISLALESNEFHFMVSDDGVGLREDFDPFSAQTLGLVLVNTLVKQLNGVMSVIRTAGTKFLIRFPVSTL